MIIGELTAKILKGQNFKETLDFAPYENNMGFQIILESGQVIMRMPYKHQLIGSPVPPRLHGGAIGSLLEITAIIETARCRALRDGISNMIAKPINLTINYLRPGAPEDTYASANVTRLGSRIAHVRTEAWQSDRNRLISTAQMNLLI